MATLATVGALMRYDVVIATLNRVDSLTRCVRQLEQQTEPPARVVIVDASDDTDSVEDRVLTGRNGSIEWVFVRSTVRSSPYQRNLGIAHTDSEVVLLPDDDSLLYPQAAAHMMAAYRADEDRRVAAVSLVGVDRSPLQDGHHRPRTPGLKERVEPLRDQIEARTVPKPFVSYPQSLWRDVPGWIDGKTYRLVPSIGGYRLSLRAELARKYPFDETMGHRIGYALHEDMELSMRLQRAGYLLVGAQAAPVFHDAHPGARAGGFDYGFCWIANYVYACRRNMPAHSPSFSRDLPRFLRYKVALYHARALSTRDAYDRNVLAGAREAWARRQRLLSADPADLPAAYRALCDGVVAR